MSRRNSSARRIDRERRERDLTADPTTLNDSELSGAVYHVQTMMSTRDARIYGRVDEVKRARVQALLAEQRRRRNS